MARPDGKADPNGGTLAALRAGLLPGLTEKKHQGIYIHATSGKIMRYFPGLVASGKLNHVPRFS